MFILFNIENKIMKFEEFKILSKNYNLIPVYEIITADLLTPVLAYLKIRENNSQSFLLESVEGSMSLARYSFIGKNPYKIIKNKKLELIEKTKNKENTLQKNIFDFIKDELKKYNQPKLEELPDFTGGIVGYLGYENVSLFETVLNFNSYRNNGFDNYDSILGLYKNILAFDHYKHQIILISNVFLDDFININDINNPLEAAYQSAQKEISKLKNELNKPFVFTDKFILKNETNNEIDKESFHQLVEQCKQNIIEGDIFQIVPSKRFSTNYEGELFNVYRALRIINPSPYMYYLEFENGVKVAGTSPEDLLKVKNRKAQLLPIAGTRRRGRTKEEEIILEEDLKNDPKEKAEHTMLVDLGRNDLGRVCKYDSVKVTQMMEIHKYSHVMHLVSKIEGELSEDKNSIDALMSCFPAGTVTGAPKIRAMELIYEYEKLPRNVYAGAVGYFDFSGNLDMCIAIRTLFVKEDKIYWQAGAGIVADSKSELEAKEIQNKAAVILNALKFAEVIDENISNR